MSELTRRALSLSSAQSLCCQSSSVYCSSSGTDQPMVSPLISLPLECSCMLTDPACSSAERYSESVLSTSTNRGLLLILPCFIFPTYTPSL